MGAGVTPAPWLAADLAVLWLGMALPLPRLLLWRRRGDAPLVALRVALLAGLRRAYAPRGAAFWLSPLADLPVAARLTWSVLRPGRTWRGRTYGASGSCSVRPASTAAGSHAGARRVEPRCP
jgi:dolichol-phosphate mannosyltransferase